MFNSSVKANSRQSNQEQAPLGPKYNLNTTKPSLPYVLLLFPCRSSRKAQHQPRRNLP